MRRECAWCKPMHPIDGGGPITELEREAGVSHGFCAEAREGAMAELHAHRAPVDDAEQIEREALQTLTTDLKDSRFDEAGIEIAKLPAELAIRYVIYGAAAATVIWIVASLLN